MLVMPWQNVRCSEVMYTVYGETRAQIRRASQQGGEIIDSHSSGRLTGGNVFVIKILYL